jgi:hypothetical protein
MKVLRTLFSVVSFVFVAVAEPISGPFHARTLRRASALRASADLHEERARREAALMRDEAGDMERAANNNRDSVRHTVAQLAHIMSTGPAPAPDLYTAAAPAVPGPFPFDRESLLRQLDALAKGDPLWSEMVKRYAGNLVDSFPTGSAEPAAS